MLAIGEGYFADEGLEVRVESINGSGAVLQGPASTPQQRFEARVRDGWVEVRPA